MLVGLVGGVAVLPLDGWLSSVLTGVSLGGDIRRELEALQQYGQLSVSIIVAAVIAVMDPKRTRRLLDWGLALALTSLSGLMLKAVLGRPRPVFDEPLTLLGPIGARPLPNGEAVVRPIQLGADGVSALWSMPSSHTAAAAVMTVFLGTLYPRLRPIVGLLVAVVAVGRMTTGAHYPSDVLVGACLGAAIAGLATSRGWGVRLVDWVWLRLIDRNAQPAWPQIDALDRPVGRDPTG